MREDKRDVYKKIEVLIGLNLFDIDQIDEDEKKAYKQFFKSETKFSNDTDKLISWYINFMPESVKNISSKVTGYIKLTSILLFLISLIIGISAAGVLFKYEGSVPINVLPILLIFVLIPVTFLLLSLIFPYLNQSGIISLSPIFHWIENRVEAQFFKNNNNNKQALKYKLDEFQLDFIEPILYLFRKNFQKSAAAYVVGALLWMIINVTTTDLAFSWSSTLEVEGDKIYTITNIMSAPWSWIAPSATVDLETVNSTRFFRADSSDISSTSSGQWWTFIFMSMLVYNLIPRTLAFFYFKWRLKNSMNASLNDLGYAILSLHEDSIFIKATDESNYKKYSEPDQTSIPNETTHVILLLWNLSDLKDKKLKNLNRNVISIHKISGLDSPKNDKNFVKKIVHETTTHDDADIILFVKFWESPNIRIEKILKEIVGINIKCTIKIIPLYEEKNQCNSINEKNWRTRITSLNKEIGGKRIFLKFDDLINKNDLL